MAFTPFDSEFENFIDFDNGFHSPSGLQSPSASTFALDPSQSMFSADSFESGRTFPGPSHEYSRYRQLTGLPTGAMTAIPLDAEIKMEDFSMMPSTQSMPFMDFNNSTFNFDTEFDPMQQDSTYFFNGNMNSFADTSAISTQVPMQMPIMPTQQQRLYPGMHTQQAQQAQAEAAARQQRQQQMGREIMQQQQLPQLHRPSIGASTASMPATRANSVVSMADTGVDNKISRLLDQMRNSNNMDIIDEEPGSPSDEPSRSGRSKKEEEDMDEDERLLASEEGKKLSSKERRQLRNKVSARAFRSRRKEYIGQLEGEVAAKVAECDELKRRNRHQAEQIAQLTKLTRSLLSHPAFATFAEDLSNDPSILAQPTSTSATSSTSSTSTVKPSQQKTQAKQQQQQQQSTESDSQQQQQQQQEQQQSTTTQRNSLDFSMLNLGSSHWNASGTGYSFQQPTVMALYDVPCPDVLPERTLSGKDDVLTQILSPSNMSRSIAAPKYQQPRLSQVADAQEDTFLPLIVNSVESSAAASATETQQTLDEINAAFDQFELQIQSLNVMMGEPTCQEKCT